MKTQRGRMRLLSWLLGRGTVAVVTAVTALALVVPVAGATPESDAAAAIDAAWTAAGGDTSSLGARSGDVYAVPGGFGQDFAGGAVFFSPDTGAHLLQGAILDKFRAVGGTADLGFPNADESAGRAPQSRNSLFSGADRPVIFWTPDTGAVVVRGALNAAWDRLGGSSGVLGVPTADETYDGDVVSQTFSGGQISFDTRTKTFTTVPPELAGQLADVTAPGDATSAINAVFRAAGGATGALGERQGDQFAIAPDGAGQKFAGGVILYSPATGAHAVSGAILEKYDAAGGPTGDLGLPNAAEADGGVPDSRVSSFAAQDNPVIFWTAANGAVIVRGAMKAAWDKLGGAAGALGVPVADQQIDGDATSQKFSGGALSWNAKTNAFTTDPANLAESLGGLAVPTAASPPPATPHPPKDNAFSFHTWWLWWIIPLALLLLASLYAVRSAGRRRGAQPDFAAAEPDPGRWTPPADNWKAAAEPAAPPPPWSARTPTGTAVDDELFTHRGAHEAPEDSDAIDTAPTRVHTDLSAEAPGRHAAAERPDWPAGEDEPYVPGPGSLFAPVYGAAPPPADGDHYDGDHYDGDRRAEYLDVVDADVVDAGMIDAEVIDQDGVVVAEEAGSGVQAAGDGVALVDDDNDDDFPVEDLYDEPFDDDGYNQRYADPYLPPRIEPVADSVVEQPIPPAIHLPLDDPTEAPAGYPVKGQMSTGTYHTPDSDDYDMVVAEIWFTDAGHAEANGFTRG